MTASAWDIPSWVRTSSASASKLSSGRSALGGAAPPRQRTARACRQGGDYVSLCGPTPGKTSRRVSCSNGRPPSPREAQILAVPLAVDFRHAAGGAREAALHIVPKPKNRHRLAWSTARSGRCRTRPTAGRSAFEALPDVRRQEHLVGDTVNVDEHGLLQNAGKLTTDASDQQDAPKDMMQTRQRPRRLSPCRDAKRRPDRQAPVPDVPAKLRDAPQDASAQHGTGTAPGHRSRLWARVSG